MAPVTPSVPRWTERGQPDSPRVLGLYRDLGGIQECPRLAPGDWDLAFEGFVVELDEELHFNRYRLQTLSSEWAKALPWADDYRTYCATREVDCLRAGTGQTKRWTSPSTERQFGVAAPKGDLRGTGSPRWRQRALYDAMKDAFMASGRVRMARLSVHDSVGDASLNDMLYGRVDVNIDALASLLARRLGH